MGSICNMNSIDRFMRSEEGKSILNEISSGLIGKTIADVTFENVVSGIELIVSINDGDDFSFMWKDVDCIDTDYEDIIWREYFIDYPERIEWPDMKSVVEHLKEKGMM